MSASATSASSTSWNTEHHHFSYPSLNYNPTFQYDDLRTKIRSFLLSFDAHIKETRDTILESKHSHLQLLAEEKERINQVDKQIDSLHAKHADLIRRLEKERQEADQVQQSISEFARQKTKTESRRAELQRKLNQLRETLEQRKEVKALRDRAISVQAAKNEPELRAYEEMLAMTMVGIRKECISFIFTHINETDWKCEYSFTIDISGQDYKVTMCNPPLPRLTELVGLLNADRDFYAFLKQMRKAFAEIAKFSK